jgi:3-dehydroquinate dehydratase/shikimate dehydrogenase
VAAQIGAVNTLVKQSDGTFKGYNTDWLAAISAIEQELSAAEARSSGDASSSSSSSSSNGEASSSSSSSSSPLQGKRFLVVGAGGAGKALAFGAAARGAHVLIANRNK